MSRIELCFAFGSRCVNLLVHGFVPSFTESSILKSKSFNLKSSRTEVVMTLYSQISVP